MKSSRYTEDISGLFYRQYYRLTRIVTYLKFGMNYLFLTISLSILRLCFEKVVFIYFHTHKTLKEALWSHLTVLVRSI